MAGPSATATRAANTIPMYTYLARYQSLTAGGLDVPILVAEPARDAVWWKFASSPCRHKTYLNLIASRAGITVTYPCVSCRGPIVFDRRMATSV